MADGEGVAGAVEEVPVEVAPAEDQKAEEAKAEEPVIPAAEGEAESTAAPVADGVSAAAAPVAEKLKSFKDLVVAEADHETPALEFTEDSPPPTPQSSKEAPGPVPSDSEFDVTSVPRELGDGLAATAESKLKEVLPENDELPAVAASGDDDAAEEPEMVDASASWLDNIYPSMKRRADSVVNHPVVAKTTEILWQTAGAAHERVIQPIVSHPYVQKGTETLKAGGAYTMEKGRSMRLAPILGFVIGVALLGVAVRGERTRAACLSSDSRFSGFAVRGIHLWRCGPNNEQACPTMAELSCELRSRATHLKSVGHTKFSETFGDKFSDLKVGDKFHKFVEQFSDKLGFHKKIEL